MHELSIANAIVAEVSEAAERHDVARVASVTVKVGRLSGVVAGALEFGWTVVRQGTPMADTELIVEDEPVVTWCPVGEHTVNLGGDPGAANAATALVFRCEVHDCTTPEILQGERLEIARFEPAEVAA